MQFTFEGTPNSLQYGHTYTIVASPKEAVAVITVTLRKAEDPTDKGVSIERWEENGGVISFKIPEKWKIWSARKFRPGLYRIEIRAYQPDNQGSGTDYALNLA